MYDMTPKNRGKYTMSGKHIINTSKIFQRGKTHVPSSVREMLDVGDGDLLVWIIERGRVYLESSRVLL